MSTSICRCRCGHMHLKHDIYQCNNGLVLISYDSHVDIASKVAHMVRLLLNSAVLLYWLAFMLNMANAEHADVEQTSTSVQVHIRPVK